MSQQTDKKIKSKLQKAFTFNTQHTLKSLNHLFTTLQPQGFELKPQVPSSLYFKLI